MMKRHLFTAILLVLAAVLPGHSAPKTAGISRLGHAIQMGAFADVNNAERFAAMLQKKGIDAFYFRKDNGVYAVRFGDFPSKEKARAVARKLVADRMIDSFYIAPPSEIVFAAPRGAMIQRLPADEIRQTRAARPAEAAKQDDPAHRPQAKASRTDRDMGGIAARTAERFVGIPYRWGGDNVVEGMDCSGFVRAVYNLCGISIPRTSREQYRVGEPVTMEDLSDGDLLFFGSDADKINHVGIYVGNGRFVHAPRRGEEIKVSSVGDGYFEKRFIGARRYF